MEHFLATVRKWQDTIYNWRWLSKRVDAFLALSLRQFFFFVVCTFPLSTSMVIWPLISLIAFSPVRFLLLIHFFIFLHHIYDIFLATYPGYDQKGSSFVSDLLDLILAPSISAIVLSSSSSFNAAESSSSSELLPSSAMEENCNLAIFSS